MAYLRRYSTGTRFSSDGSRTHGGMAGGGEALALSKQRPSCTRWWSSPFLGSIPCTKMHPSAYQACVTRPEYTSRIRNCRHLHRRRSLVVTLPTLCLSNLDFTHEKLEHRDVQVSLSVSSFVREGPILRCMISWSYYRAERCLKMNQPPLGLLVTWDMYKALPPAAVLNHHLDSIQQSVLMPELPVCRQYRLQRRLTTLTSQFILARCLLLPSSRSMP